MLKIRLTRLGAKKPFLPYRCCWTHVLHVKVVLLTLLVNRSATKQPAIVNVDEEKALAWLAKGAQPTDTVRSLFKNKALCKNLLTLKVINREAYHDDRINFINCEIISEAA